MTTAPARAARPRARGCARKLGGGQPGDIKTKALDGLRQAAALVAAKAPEDAAAFKAWLAQISQNVAEAASEGGFLGFGGVKVSDAEKATLGGDHQRPGLTGRVRSAGPAGGLVRASATG